MIVKSLCCISHWLLCLMEWSLGWSHASMCQQALPHARFGVPFLLTWLKGIQVCKQDHGDLLRDKGTYNDYEKRCWRCLWCSAYTSPLRDQRLRNLTWVVSGCWRKGIQWARGSDLSGHWKTMKAMGTEGKGPPFTQWPQEEPEVSFFVRNWKSRNWTLLMRVKTWKTFCDYLKWTCRLQ